jgi:prepilin-type N-terminal cleavage/methylation domain-containing protein
MDKKGFSLIELLTVLAIIAVLSVIVIPGYIGQKKRASRTEAFTNLQNLRLLEEQFYAENGSYATIGRLSGWKPGPDSSLYFTYLAAPANLALPAPVPIPYKGTTVWNTNPCYIGTATWKNSSVQGDIFAIDCNNNRNF